jgi:SAM-dependent methyltransferase
MTKTREDSGWWSDRYNNRDGLGIIHWNPNGWSHDRRVSKIRDEVGAGKSVLDLGCGTGLYGFMYDDNSRYVGVDFCPEYIELAKRTVDGEFSCMDIREFVKLNEERFDVVIMCGVLSVEPLFEDMEGVFDFLKRILGFSERIVATVPWSGFNHKPTEGFREFSSDEAVRLCHEGGMSIRLTAGYIPHELLGVFTMGTWDSVQIEKSTSDFMGRQLEMANQFQGDA